MTRLIEAFLSRSRTVLLILAFLLVGGTQAYLSIPKESTPDVKVPIIYTSVHKEGVSPADSEAQIVKPLEQKLRSIEGVKEMTSKAYENGGSVTLEFTAGFDSTKALADVREKVDQAKSDFPEDTDEPIVKEVNLSLFPVLVVILSGNTSFRHLSRLANDLKDDIEQRVSSVLEATLVGDREEVVEIIINPSKLETYDLPFLEALSLVQRNNALIAAGTLDLEKGRFPVKIPGLFFTVMDILDTPVGVKKEAVVRFQDIAEIRRTFKDPRGFARERGHPAIALEISKRTGENIIETIQKVRALVAQNQKFWPPSIHVTYSQDESDDIKEMLSDLQNNVIAAVLLVMIVMVIALGWRSAVLVGVAVPGAFLTGILLIAVMGLTINIVVLFSLILSVGMLVDGAIIVAEFADRRLNEGVGKFEAYREAVQRMTWPVITSISTIVVAFLPLLYWPGLIGEFMKYLPITLIATLSASILMALIFVPTIGTLIGKKAASQSLQTQKNLRAAEQGKLKDIRGSLQLYLKLLEKALDRPGLILTAVGTCLVTILVAFSFFGKGVEFFPSVEPRTAALEVHARGNLSTREKDRLVREVEARLFGMEVFKTIYTNTEIGVGNQRSGKEYAEDTIGLITLEFVNWKKRPTADEILEEVVARTRDIPGLGIEVTKNKPGPPSGKPIDIEISARDPTVLLPEVAKIRRYLETLPGLMSFEDTRPIPGLEWRIDVNRAQAAKFGADIRTIGTGVKLVSNGLKVSTYRPSDSREEIDILLRYPPAYRTLDQLRILKIQTSQGMVPLSSFTTQSFQPKETTLRRVDGHRVYALRADVRQGVLVDTKVKEIRTWLQEEAGLPQDVHVAFKGEEEDKQETSAFLQKAFLVVIFLIGLILVTQFNSFFSAALVLSAVVLSIIGVLMGLMIFQQPFGIVMTGLGLIALAGIIVSNNIIFIDTFDLLRKKIKNKRTAILMTGLQRVRAVLLTQITTVFGLMPMVLRLNLDFLGREISYNAPSSQWWVQLSTAIVSGVTFGTLLTLFVTPCALMVRENWRDRQKPPLPSPRHPQPRHPRPRKKLLTKDRKS